MAKPDPKLQIRKLPYRIHLELSRLLDIPGEKDWRSLIAVLPDGMYTTNQVSKAHCCGCDWLVVMFKSPTNQLPFKYIVTKRFCCWIIP